MELLKEPVGQSLYMVSTEVHGIEDCCLAKKYQHGAGYNGKHRILLLIHVQGKILLLCS